MRRRGKPGQDDRPTFWANQYVSRAEREALGDDHAALLAEERRRARIHRRHDPGIDPDQVASTRDDLPKGTRITDTTVEVLAHRLHLLNGRPGLPWRDDA